MIIGKEGVTYISFFLSTISVILLWTAGHSLLGLGKSKTRIKKIEKNIPLLKKVLLIYPEVSAFKYKKKFKTLRTVYWIYLFVSFVCLLALLVSFSYPRFDKMIVCSAYLKTLLVDFPVWLYGFIMTKHGKNGGVIWRWE